jgi:hypothetical protein
VRAEGAIMLLERAAAKRRAFPVACLGTVPEGGRSRQLPMTRRLTAALRALGICEASVWWLPGLEPADRCGDTDPAGTAYCDAGLRLTGGTMPTAR